MEEKDKTSNTTYKEYLQAFLDYLRRPKTVFDFKDRTKALILLALIIIVLQKLVEKFIG